MPWAWSCKEIFNSSVAARREGGVQSIPCRLKVDAKSVAEQPSVLILSGYCTIIMIV